MLFNDIYLLSLDLLKVLFVILQASLMGLMGYIITLVGAGFSKFT